MSVIQIDGVDIRDPTTISISRNKMWSQGSGRTKSGNFTGDISNVKWRLDLTWSPLSKCDAKNLFDALDPAFINVRFLNPKTNSYQTIKCYGGDMTLPVYNYNVEEAVYESLTVSLVEK
ncbi:MAG: DUF6711 family protein [Longibaculum sp.]